MSLFMDKIKDVIIFGIEKIRNTSLFRKYHELELLKNFSDPLISKQIYVYCKGFFTCIVIKWMQVLRWVWIYIFN